MSTQIAIIVLICNVVREAEKGVQSVGDVSSRVLLNRGGAEQADGRG